MRITLRGWSRDMGEKVLMDSALEDASISDNGTVYRDRAPIIAETFRGLYIAWYQKLEALGISSKYRMEIQLRRGEIMRLFRRSYGNELCADLIEKHGFTISDDLRNAVLKTVKLSDLTLGELAAMSAAPTEKELPSVDASVIHLDHRKFVGLINKRGAVKTGAAGFTTPPQGGYRFDRLLR